MATVHFDLATYIKISYEIVGDIPWWNVIKDLSKELEDDYFRSLNPEPGTCIYGDFGAVKI